MAITIQIEGLAELQAAVARMGTGLDEDIRAALLKAAQTVVTAAAGRAPHRTGRLAGSIRAFTEEAAAGVEVTARSPDRWNYPYGIKIERRQPYLEPAFRAEAEGIMRDLQPVLDDIVRKWGG